MVTVAVSRACESVGREGVTHSNAKTSTYLILLTQILYIMCNLTNTMSTCTTEYPAITIFKSESMLPSVLYCNNTSRVKSEARRSPSQCSSIFCDEKWRKTNFQSVGTESVYYPSPTDITEITESNEEFTTALTMIQQKIHSHDVYEFQKKLYACEFTKNPFFKILQHFEKFKFFPMLNFCIFEFS